MGDLAGKEESSLLFPDVHNRNENHCCTSGENHNDLKLVSKCTSCIFNYNAIEMRFGFINAQVSPLLDEGCNLVFVTYEDIEKAPTSVEQAANAAPQGANGSLHDHFGLQTGQAPQISQCLEQRNLIEIMPPY
eukprot:scaffold5993_cov30-Prasinocladus_malaysianus.AAC.2